MYWKRPRVCHTILKVRLDNSTVQKIRTAKRLLWLNSGQLLPALLAQKQRRVYPVESDLWTPPPVSFFPSSNEV